MSWLILRAYLYDARTHSMLMQFEASRHLLLEHAFRVILLARRLQSLHVLRPVATDGVLARIGIVQILVLVQQSHATGNIVRICNHLAARLPHQCIVGGAVPDAGQKHHDCIAVFGRRAKRVPSVLGPMLRDDRGQRLKGISPEQEAWYGGRGHGLIETVRDLAEQ